MTADGAALLRAILESPADDAPRLVYADWLEERGEERDSLRAEFIRLDIEISRRPKLARNQAGGKAWERARRLWGYPSVMDTFGFNNTQARWTMERWPDWPPVAFYYRRGFVETAEMPTAAFLEHAPALFAAHPITAVRLTDREPYFNGAGRGWFRQNRPRHSTAVPDSSMLPDDLFDCLTEWLRLTPSGYQISGTRYRVYALAEHARAALSRACVSYGRSLAGLPPLSPREAVPA